MEGEGVYVLSGGLHHDEVREACGFEFPEGRYETVAGFVLDRCSASHRWVRYSATTGGASRLSRWIGAESRPFACTSPGRLCKPTASLHGGNVVTLVLASSSLNPWVGILLGLVLILSERAVRRGRVRAHRRSPDSDRSARRRRRSSRPRCAGLDARPARSRCRARSSASPSPASAWASLPNRRSPIVIETAHRDPSAACRSGLLHGSRFGLALFVVVFLHMVLGEMVPKNLALAAAERTCLFVAAPHRLFVQLFRPVIWLLNGMAALLLQRIRRATGRRARHRAHRPGVRDHDRRVQGRGLIDEFSHGLLSGALDFRTARRRRS